MMMMKMMMMMDPGYAPANKGRVRYSMAMKKQAMMMIIIIIIDRTPKWSISDLLDDDDDDDEDEDEDGRQKEI